MNDDIKETSRSFFKFVREEGRDDDLTHERWRQTSWCHQDVELIRNKQNASSTAAFDAVKGLSFTSGFFHIFHVMQSHREPNAGTFLVCEYTSIPQAVDANL